MANKYFRKDEMSRFEEFMYLHEYNYDTDLYTRKGLSPKGSLTILIGTFVVVFVATIVGIVLKL